MNEIVIEVKLQLVLSLDGKLNVKVSRIGGGMSKRVKGQLLGRSRSDNAAYSESSSDGSHSYHELPLDFLLASTPLTDHIEAKDGRKTAGGEMVEKPNG